MTIADRLAQLMADVNVQAPLSAPNYKIPDQNPLVKTRTVYSVGEAVKGKERVTNAKLGAGTF